MNAKKIAAALLAVVLLIGVGVGGTLAWLTAQTTDVVNTFTTSNIGVTLEETKNDFQMIPGWTIDKDPKVTVTADSEDCWLFVKITESTAPDLDAYIAYAIAGGWETVQSENDAGEIVIGRKVYKTDAIKAFDILGAGEFVDPMGTNDTTEDDCKISWEANQVGVKPSVTKQMMTDVATNKPMLTFTAYASQLYKNNNQTFTAEEAWTNLGA